MPPEKPTPAPVDVLSLLSLSCLTALSFSIFIIAALPILFLQSRLPDPIPKAVALAGAILAVVGLSAPVPWIAGVFTLAIVLADTLHRRGRVFPALFASVAAALAVILAFFFLSAQQQGVQPAAYWNGLVDGWMAQARMVLEGGMATDWTAVDSLLRHQGPFLLVAGLILSAWVSLGAAAHWGWAPGPKPLNAKALRKQARLPQAVYVAVTLGWAASMALPAAPWGVGVGRILATLLFLQGCVCLSLILNRLGTSFVARTLIYSLGVVLGFYALLALGVVSPLYFRVEEKKKK